VGESGGLVVRVSDGWVENIRERGVAGASCPQIFAQEMQKASSQFSVLSSQFSVLSSQFSVLSSQFSVLREGSVSLYFGLHRFEEVKIKVKGSGQECPLHTGTGPHKWV
jgi:hypothetical protein